MLHAFLGRRIPIRDAHLHDGLRRVAQIGTPKGGRPSVNCFSKQSRRSFATQPPVKTYFAHERQDQWKDLTRAVRWSTYAATVSSLVLVAVYFSSFETAPLTGRRRLMLALLVDKQSEIEKWRKLLYLGIWDPSSNLRPPYMLSDEGQMVVLARDVLRKLITCNGFESLDLELHVLDSPSRYFLVCLYEANPCIRNPLVAF
jgi:hypothetical protein